MMVGAFLISFLMSIGRGIEDFLVSQTTMFSNDRTISVSQQIGMMDSFGFGGSTVNEFQEETPAQNTVTPPGQNQEIPSGATIPDTTSSGQNINSEAESMISASKLEQADLEKIRDVEHVEEADFQSYLSPDYVRLEEPDSKKLNVMVYSLPVSLIEDLNFTYVDRNKIDVPNTIILSDNYASTWGISAQDLIGKKVFVRVTSAVPLTGETNPGNQEFELTIAGFTEKSLLSQMGFITNSTYNQLAAYRYQKPLEEFEKNQSGLEIIVIVDKTENVDEVDKKLGNMDFQSQTMGEALGQIGSIFDILTYILSGFGVVALVVASIGIANTLMMAVYERTREIGVMKAVGATRGTISLLFTIEAGMLGFWGGVLGLLLGFGLGRLLNLLLHQGLKLGNLSIIPSILADYPKFNISLFTPDMIILVISVTTIVALVAGLYPAWRAGKLNAIEALRHD
jgi:putative ABC transport system permease protein